MQRIENNRFDLLISDLCMPEMDGPELHRRICEKDKSLARRMIFVTGDTVSPQSRTFLEKSGNRWLSKPFNISDIENTVRTVLEQEPLMMLTGHGADSADVAVRRYHPQRS
jgi:two-component system NtrC family sensor kinase